MQQTLTEKKWKHLSNSRVEYYLKKEYLKNLSFLLNANLFCYRNFLSNDSVIRNSRQKWPNPVEQLTEVWIQFHKLQKLGHCWNKTKNKGWNLEKRKKMSNHITACNYKQIFLLSLSLYLVIDQKCVTATTTNQKKNEEGKHWEHILSMSPFHFKSTFLDLCDFYSIFGVFNVIVCFFLLLLLLTESGKWHISWSQPFFSR